MDLGKDSRSSYSESDNHTINIHKVADDDDKLKNMICRYTDTKSKWSCTKGNVSNKPKTSKVTILSEKAALLSRLKLNTSAVLDYS